MLFQFLHKVCDETQSTVHSYFDNATDNMPLRILDHGYRRVDTFLVNMAKWTFYFSFDPLWVFSSVLNAQDLQALSCFSLKPRDLSFNHFITVHACYKRDFEFVEFTEANSACDSKAAVSEQCTWSIARFLCVSWATCHFHVLHARQ